MSTKFHDHVIKRVIIDREAYVNRNDLVSLILKLKNRSVSLNARADLEHLVKCLENGEEFLD